MKRIDVNYVLRNLNSKFKARTSTSQSSNYLNIYWKNYWLYTIPEYKVTGMLDNYYRFLNFSNKYINEPSNF